MRFWSDGNWNRDDFVRRQRGTLRKLFLDITMNNHRTSQNNRQGFTLVEMMISVALTLMVVFALVRVFETLGDSVTDGRASIEVSSSLRTAAQLLQSDLEGVTTTTLPPRNPEQGEGYIELIDGPGTDSQYRVFNSVVNQAGMLRLSELDSAVDRDSDGYLDDETFDTAVGDVDDILAFTSHSNGEPFSGTISDPRIAKPGPNVVPYLENTDNSGTPNDATDDIKFPIPTQILESQDAEIVWWLQVERTPNDVGLDELSGLSSNLNGWQQQLNLACYADRDITGDPQIYPSGTTPVRSLHRRVLLVLPSLNLSAIRLRSETEVEQFLSNNDISVRVIRESTNVWRVEPNSLADLSERENRSYRSSWRFVAPSQRSAIAASRLLPTFDANGNQFSRPNGVTLDPRTALLRQAAMKDMVVTHPAYVYESTPGLPGSQTQTPARPNVIMLRKGRDVVLNDVLSFDLQVWDPAAIVRGTTDGDIVVPSDPGYRRAINLAGAPDGAFVDLGHAVPPKSISVLPASFHGNFGGAPWTKSLLPLDGSSGGTPSGITNGFGCATFCSWSSTYERDGFNQDGDQFQGSALIDEGHDGLDNDGINGVDDPGELETSPPYPHPLVGLKVTLRTLDFGTRQVRQTSVVQDFLSE